MSSEVEYAGETEFAVSKGLSVPCRSSCCIQGEPNDGV